MTIRLRSFNNFLSIVVIGLGLYIMVFPFFPQVEYVLQDKSPEASAPYAGALADSIGSDVTQDIPQENRIVIPSIQIDEPIKEGRNIWTINSGGTWRRPDSSNPTRNSNTVIVGHRFYQNNVSTFYHLDKVIVGHQMALYWDGVEHLYEVTETRIVDATQVDIEAPTAEKQLTLYTCHPLWTAKQRLVIIAKPVQQEGDQT